MPQPNERGGAERVRAFHDLFQSMEELRKDVRSLKVKNVKWRHRFYAAFAAVLVVSGIVVAVTSTSTSFKNISGEVFTYDASLFTVTSSGHQLTALTAAAVGTTDSLAGAAEMVAANAGAANTALTAGNWQYRVTVAEQAAGSVPAVTSYFKVELFVDGVSQGSVYMKDAVNDVSAAGILIKFDIGSDLPANGAYVLKITQRA